MLTDTMIRKLKPNGKQQKFSDGNWLYLVVSPAGKFLWRMGYRFNGKEKTLSIGKYPEVSLLDARCARDGARKLVAAGEDPSARKQAEKAAKTAVLPTSTFKSVALEWFEKKTQD